MRNLLRFIAKHYFLLLFLVLEIISFFLIIKSDVRRRNSFFTSANVVTGFLYDRVHFISEYLSLKEENERLARELVHLRNNSVESYRKTTNVLYYSLDTSYLYSYSNFKYLVDSLIKQVDNKYNSTNKEQYNTYYVTAKVVKDEIEQITITQKNNTISDSLLLTCISFADKTDSTQTPKIKKIEKALKNDSLRQYFYTPATVINNTIYRKTNYLTINKGTRHGVLPDMAVISANGIVGVVQNASKNYATIISVLNTKLGVSAKLKNSKFYGSIKWDGLNYRKVILNEIPNHAVIHLGDSVVTSGYSIIFPEGIMIGTISDFAEDSEGSNFYDIKLKLSTDMKKLNHVFVVGNFLKDEQKELEKAIINE